MDISKAKVDSKLIEAGEWVRDIPEMDDLGLRVRGMNNTDYENMQIKLINAVPFKRRRRGLVKADRDRIQCECLIETVLYDWENFQDGGAVVAYSKDTARKYIFDPDYRALRDAVVFAATTVGAAKDEELEVTEKNSGAPSVTV